MAFIGQLPEGELKKWLHYQCFTSCFQVRNYSHNSEIIDGSPLKCTLCCLPQILGGAISAVITYHNPENMPKDGICVANHTSPIDVLILACDNAYALVREGPRLYNFQMGEGECRMCMFLEN